MIFCGFEGERVGAKGERGVLHNMLASGSAGEGNKPSSPKGGCDAELLVPCCLLYDTMDVGKGVVDRGLEVDEGEASYVVID